MSEDDSMKHEGKWTRADLPSWDKIRDADDMAGNGLRSRVIDIALNEVVEHLNTHHSKPEPDKWRAEWVAVSEDLKAARRQSDLAHEQWQKWEAQAGRAESGRNAAVASAEQLDKNLAKVMSDYQDVEDECDELKEHLKVTEEALGIERKQHEETFDHVVQANQRWLAAIVERDEWKARADQLRDERDDAVQSCMAVGRERDEWKALAEKAHADWEDIAEEFADFRVEVVAEAVKHRESRPTISRADIEKAMADAAPGLVPYGACVDAVHALVFGTAPAVTKAEIEQAIRNTSVHYDCDCTQDEACAGLADEVDAVWSLVSGADPAVYVVRESDIAAVEVERHEGGGMETPMLLAHLDEPPSVVRNPAANYLQCLAETEAIARAIEAEQAVDPVEDAAVAAFKAEWHRADEEGDEGNRVRRGIRAARHVLGQEATR